jgi:tetratricopeptide (TPR) repeat protein
MMHRIDNSEQSRRGAALILLLIVIFLIYSNTFHSSWHFDDFPNIVLNPYLKISDLEPETLLSTFFANREDGLYPQTKMYRPLACLSLALNWYIGGNNVVGYHIVNLWLHLMSAFFLFLIILNIFKSPNLSGKYTGSEYFVALLTATLWAVNPIQTQAVTYIVQRMASMAAMFYILGIYFYIKGRLQSSPWKSYVFFLACLISYVCALGAKENAATLPIAIIMLEVIFFQDLSSSRTRKRIFWITAGTGLGVVLLGTLFFLKGDPLGFLEHYSERSFSPLQRLMTESRILIFYLTLIFYPVPTRLSIEHDFALSTSLVNPWTTLISILLIFGLIGVGVSQIRRRPVLSFAVLFFFLNHLIESSIIGLELIFEHRNYLPSLFIFFPVAVGIKWLLDYYRDQKRGMHHVMVAFVTLVIMGLGIGTYVRNITWFTEKSLWEDAMQKAPNSKRPYHNLAWGHYWRNGQYDKALELYEKTLGFKTHSNISKARVINNIGFIHFIKGDIHKASERFHEAYRLYPHYALFQLNLAKAKFKSGEWQAALALLEKILSRVPDHRMALSLKAQVLLNQKRFSEAVDSYLQLLKQRPDDQIAMLNAGIGLRLMGNLDRAKWFLKAANRIDPQDISSLFWLIETNLQLEDSAQADEFLDRLFARFPIDALFSALDDLRDGNLMPAASQKTIIQKLRRKLEAQSAEMAQLDNR